MGEVCVWGGGGVVVGLWLSCLWRGFLYVAPNDESESLLIKSIVKKKKKKILCGHQCSDLVIIYG